ncbi:hypothetical protein GCK72_022307 [Caenorhabditis remanei]|uniref:Uncharacterized protein n=2 Tax=Caenorhabditis remanei TaxID=31234 RepID=E3M9W0_CAERE|nr:hypothetical protein GCK72_022307 [Caenorhabditis remanei]EFO96749.1 hypothetical protein CRE_17045 [Caenorhabditis remanei]KAF1745860.1 hypothetical protein GCK72_022307 [Caenorhabditis remanei]
MWVPLYEVLDQNIPNWRNLSIREINSIMRGWGQVRVLLTTNNRKYRGVLKLWEMSSETIFGRGQTIQDDLENRGFLVCYPRDRVTYMEGMGAFPIQFIKIQQ